MDEYEKKKSKRGRGEERTTFNDEKEREMEDMRDRERRKRGDFDEVMRRMTSDKKEEMRHQDKLRVELQIAYKRGDMSKVRKLESRLAPDLENEEG